LKQITVIQSLVFGAILAGGGPANAVVVGWGATTSNATHSYCPSFCVVPPGVIESDSDGGEFSTGAASSLNNSSGDSRAEVTLSSTTFTPTLRVYAESDGFVSPAQPGTGVDAGAVGAQGYTYTGAGETISLSFSFDAFLDETFDSTSKASATARIAVIFANDLDFFSTPDSFGTLVFEAAPSGSVKGQTSIFANIDSGTSGDVTAGDTFSFDVLPGDEFLVWASLEAEAFRGGVADAFNTFSMSFNEEARDSLAAAGMPNLSAVPIPAAAWLFGSALIGLVGFSKRRKAA
jgi:hypothetical protein